MRAGWTSLELVLGTFVVGAFVLAGPASADDAAVVTLDPRTAPWIKKPTWQDMWTYYPYQAREEQLEGRAVVQCAVTGDGHLTSCKVLEEKPQGYRFGMGATKLMRFFQMKPALEDGRSVDGAVISMSIRFVPPQEVPEL